MMSSTLYVHFDVRNSAGKVNFNSEFMILSPTQPFLNQAQTDKMH